MNNSKARYDSKWKVTRIAAGDYALLKEMSRRAGISMAEALHLALERQEQVARVSPAQIPMPAFRVAPVVTGIAVNGAGAKHSAFAIKPKGGVRYG